MSVDIARIEFTAGDDCPLVVETADNQFRFSNGREDEPSLWIDYDDVPQLVAFLLAMKDA